MRGPAGVLRWLLIAAVATACTGAGSPPAVPSGDAASDPPAAVTAERPTLAGGTVRVGVVGATAGPDLLTLAVLAPLWRVRPDGVREPWLLAGEPQVVGGVGGAPHQVTYELRDDAVWSDGQPIDGGDVVFTLRACQRSAPERRGGRPCDAVDLSRTRASGRQVTVTFGAPRGDWRDLLATAPVLPAHVFAGAEPTADRMRALTVSSGPFQVASWPADGPLELVPNARWWGLAPTLDRLTVTVDPTMGVHDVVADVADVVAGDATLDAVEQARAHHGARVAVVPGRRWAAVDLHAGAPSLSRTARRRAVAGAIDPGPMVAEVIAPIAPTTEVRRRLLDGGDADATAPSAPPVAPEDAWRATGCIPGDDGLVCDGRPLTLRLTLGDDAWQTPVVAEYVRAQLAGAGVTVREAGPATPGAWDLRVTTVDDDPGVSATAERWRCGGAPNDLGYCSPAYDAALDRAATALDPARRTAALRAAEQVLADDRPTEPLFAVPRMIVIDDRVRGPALNPAYASPVWNAQEWARTGND